MQARLRAWPADPLFDRLDADDPDAETLSFEHLEKGLVRVVLPLADNLDVIDEQGHVITNAERTVFVWRGVPSVANTVYTAPYQSDGRERSLEEQAQSALRSHSEGPDVSARSLRALADFEREQLTSGRAFIVSSLLALGVPETRVPVPEDLVKWTEQEARGREVYAAACEACHGGATTDRIVRRDVSAFFVPTLRPDGNVLHEKGPDGKPRLVHQTARADAHFMNVGFGVSTYFGQTGVAPDPFNASVRLPRYRLRFYTDATRSQVQVDLPPAPVTQSGDPLDPRPALDANGLPIVGPNLVPQLFSCDPGRAIITGDPLDFEAFDVPQLRGIARTAPYFHDNMRATLREVIDDYSRFVLPFIEPLELPSRHPPEREGGRPEALTPQQKADLLAFLQRL